MFIRSGHTNDTNICNIAYFLKVAEYDFKQVKDREKGVLLLTPYWFYNGMRSKIRQLYSPPVGCAMNG